MKQKVLILLFAMFATYPALGVFAVPQQIGISVRYDDPTLNPEHHKSPALLPTVYIDDYTVSFGSQLEGFELQILDEDGEVVYSTVIPADTTQAVLPSTLSGEYEIRFITDNYYYYGYISVIVEN